jgi:predicted transcriptional regulator
MSITQEAADALNDIGSGTVEDVMRELECYTRDQVRRALNNAATTGLIKSDGRYAQPGRREHRATGKDRGARPTIYRAIVTQQTSRPVSSVFQLAQLAA